MFSSVNHASMNRDLGRLAGGWTTSSSGQLDLHTLADVDPGALGPLASNPCTRTSSHSWARPSAYFLLQEELNGDGGQKPSPFRETSILLLRDSTDTGVQAMAEYFGQQQLQVPLSAKQLLNNGSNIAQP
jgi:hypothetical protein